MRRKVLVSEDGAAFQIGEPISLHPFTGVYKCHRPGSTVTTHAAKIYNRNAMERYPEAKQVLANEITALYAIQSPYICNKVDVFDSDRNVYIIMEYASNGTMLNWIKKNSAGGSAVDADARRWLQQLLYGLSDIHAAGHAHLDIKLDNLLVDRHECLRVCDFGFSVPFDPDDPKTKLTQDMGTPLYAAPEVLSASPEQPYDGFKADVWSAGITFYTFLAGRLPFFARTNDELLRKMREGRIPENKNISDAAFHFIRCCLEPDPEKRWSVDRLLHHPYCRGLDRLRGSDTPMGTGGGLTPMSSQTADALFPTDQPVDRADAAFVMSSLSYTSMSLCDRTLNEQQLKQWRALSRKTKQRREKFRRQHQEKQQQQQQQQQQSFPGTSTGVFKETSSLSAVSDSGAQQPHKHLFEIDETNNSNHYASAEEDDDDGTTSVRSRASALSERLAKNDKEQWAVSSVCSAPTEYGSSSTSGGGTRKLGIRKVMSREGDLDSIDDSSWSDTGSSVAGGGGSITPRGSRQGMGDRSLMLKQVLRNTSRPSSVDDAKQQQQQQQQQQLTPSSRGSQHGGGGGTVSSGGGANSAARPPRSSGFIQQSAPFASGFHLRRFSDDSAANVFQREMTAPTLSKEQRPSNGSFPTYASDPKSLFFNMHSSSPGAGTPRSSSNTAAGGTAASANSSAVLMSSRKASSLNSSPASSAKRGGGGVGGGGEGGTTGGSSKGTSPIPGEGSSPSTLPAVPRLPLRRMSTPSSKEGTSPTLANNIRDGGISPFASAGAAAAAGSQPSSQGTPRRASAVASPPGSDLSRVMSAKPSIYLRLELNHFVLVIRWLFVVLQFIVVGLLRIFFNIKLEKYINVDGPLGQFLQVDDQAHVEFGSDAKEDGSEDAKNKKKKDL